jgi:hypothetical protein
MTGLLAWDLLCATIGPPLVSAAGGRILRRRGRTWNFYSGWIGSAAGGAIGWAVSGAWGLMALDIANICLAVFLWWLSRRRRKRAPRAYGAKSRALVAAVVARMRETLKPRPILRPVPGGAR